MTLPVVNILEAMDHPSIWAGWFKNPRTWRPWRAFLSVLFGLPMDAAGLALYRQCTGRTNPPHGGCTEAWLVVGRRGGKSMILALIACYLAVFRDWRPYLSPGETGTIKIIATDRKQARVIFRYCRALLTQVPAFGSLVAKADDDEIRLTTRVVIEVQTASFRSVRGFTVVALLADEIAYWRNDETAANPDAEIIAAIRPAMATIPNAMFLAASSPYAKRGELYEAYRRYHGKDNAPALVWQAETRTMNSTVPQAFIDAELERDPAKASAEFRAEFRSDIENFISREVVDAAVVPDRFELPRKAGISYVGFVDPAGGSGTDSMTLAIAHRDNKDGRAILDCIRERRPPFSPELVTHEFAGTCKAYGITRVVGDHWGGDWPKERFATHGITYTTSERTKSQIYQESLPLLNSGQIELLDHPRLISQLCALERRTARSGRDSIDHPPGGHDDVVNSVAGSLAIAASAKFAPMQITPDILRRATLGRSRTIVGAFPRP